MPASENEWKEKLTPDPGTTASLCSAGYGAGHYA